VSFDDDQYEVFSQIAQSSGIDKARERLKAFRATDEELDALEAEYRRRLEAIESGYPDSIIALPHQDHWYDGPRVDDVHWPSIARYLAETNGWDAARIGLVDQASSKIVAYTRNPGNSGQWRSNGLVVGYVQSGKTTNFTSVIAKAVDRGYNLVIVMSGIHNGLRKQTQERLEEQLIFPNKSSWVPMTTVQLDFQKPTMTLGSVLPTDPRKAVFCVVKKNATVLRKLKKWLRDEVRSGEIQRVKALIIDDEADQASIETARINPLIRDILKTVPRRTFIGYTATPFANVLVNPDPVKDDLYPRDFILNLPQPDGYFGAEMIFGRDEIPDGGTDGEAIDGYDMVREVPEVEAAALRPKKNEDYEPDLTTSLKEAVLWFWLATAIRRARGDAGHSSMLLHTSMKTAVHNAFKRPLAALRKEIVDGLERSDAPTIERLRELWAKEHGRVAIPGLAHVEWEAVLEHLPEVVGSTVVVVDNSKSLDRLKYGKSPVTAIAVGGNTLSRGLTLEGLVVSFFIRSASAYDTLLQMGRWFGFRTGYEDLPRIWMTTELAGWFRHLALVEAELRMEIDRYPREHVTPLEFGPRIRTHPAMLVTQKLGAARQDYFSYGGRRVQTRYFWERDSSWLERNRVAADRLIGDVVRIGSTGVQRSDGSWLWKGVEVGLILKFLDGYVAHDESPDLDSSLLRKYIESEVKAGSLQHWNVAVMSSGGDRNGTVDLGGQTFGRIERAKLKEPPLPYADIKTLMSKEHRVTDMDIDPAEARRRSENDLVGMRNADPVQSRRGLLLLYPIDPTSEPDVARKKRRAALGASNEVIGLALVFPGNASRNVQNSYISVDLTAATPIEPLSEEGETDPVEEDTEGLGVTGT